MPLVPLDAEPDPHWQELTAGRTTLVPVAYLPEAVAGQLSGWRRGVGLVRLALRRAGDLPDRLASPRHAILLDATVVRMVLVPATMSLLGRANWWLPAWLDRVLPRLDVETAADLDQPSPVAGAVLAGSASR